MAEFSLKIQLLFQHMNSFNMNYAVICVVRHKQLKPNLKTVIHFKQSYKLFKKLLMT